MKSGAWLVADWQVANTVIAGCTFRTGGFSRGPYASLNLGAHVDDEPADVRRNRKRFLDACGLPAEPAWLRQVHGAEVVVEPAHGAVADAALSRTAGTVCAVLVADCLPVLIATSDGDEVAAAHAGWRGLCAGVLENTVAAFDASPGSLHAWLGPAISQPAFEVGGEVRDAFLAKDQDAVDCFRQNPAGRWQADLYALARRRLEAAGVNRVTGGGLCTYADKERFFSFRRDGQCGRMAGFVLRPA